MYIHVCVGGMYIDVCVCVVVIVYGVNGPCSSCSRHARQWFRAQPRDSQEWHGGDVFVPAPIIWLWKSLRKCACKMIVAFRTGKASEIPTHVPVSKDDTYIVGICANGQMDLLTTRHIPMTSTYITHTHDI